MDAHGAERLTYDDYRRLPDVGGRCDVIDGVLFRSAAGPTRHQWIVGNLLFCLGDHATRSGAAVLGWVAVVLAHDSVVEPDVIYISRDRLGMIGKDAIMGAPDIIIEVLSENTRAVDETLKLDLYRRVGIPEYWLVDPDDETVNIHRPNSERQIHRGTITTPILPNFALDIREVFAMPFTPAP